jgi:cysteine desulfurase
MSPRVFLDHNATTMPSKEVLEAIKDFQAWGNPSSIHSSGRGAKSSILKVRRAFAEAINCGPTEVIFTSGGSESNNMALKGVAQKLKVRGQTVLVSTFVEHPSVYKTFDQLEKEGFEVVRVPVKIGSGLDYEFLEKILKEKNVGLVSVMRANNETGEIFDLRRIKKLIDQNTKNEKIYFHSDMVQTLGKLSVDVKESGVDFASFSAHKFYALSGMGVLFHKKGNGIDSLIAGGGQEKGRRAGTENLLAIHAFGAQVQKLHEVETYAHKMRELRDYMESSISKNIDGVHILAQDRKRVANTSLLLVEGIHGETMLINMDLAGFEVSTGAACSSGNPEPSPVLISMGLSPKEASKSIRLSLGWQSTLEEVDRFVETLIKVVAKLRGL